MYSSSPFPASFLQKRLILALKIVAIGSLVILAGDLYSPKGAGLACGFLGLALYMVLWPVRPYSSQGIALLLLAILSGIISTAFLWGSCYFFPSFRTCQAPAFNAQVFLHFAFIIFMAITPWLIGLFYRRDA